MEVFLYRIFDGDGDNIRLSLESGHRILRN